MEGVGHDLHQCGAHPWTPLATDMVTRAGAPRALAWLGTAIGVAGLASVAPPLHEVSIAFGLLQIVWFGWLGVVLLTTRAAPVEGTKEVAR